MKARLPWSDILIFVGIIAMLIGAVDPLEGSLIILPGSGLVALGAFVVKSRHSKLLSLAFILTAVGVGALWGLSAVGGFGGGTGRSMWWALVILPYPVGWIMGLLGTIGKDRHRKLLYLAFTLMAIGLSALLVLNIVAGLEVRHSMWLALVILPYLIGVIIGLIAAILTLIESLKGHKQWGRQSR